MYYSLLTAELNILDFNIRQHAVYLVLAFKVAAAVLNVFARADPKQNPDVVHLINDCPRGGDISRATCLWYLLADLASSQTSL